MPHYELEELLATWEGNYKRGLLTLWLLLILHGEESYAFEMSEKVTAITRGRMSADEKSIYRALNRFEDLGIVASSWQDSDQGPRRRYYRLTSTGLELLRTFIQRNIMLFQTPEVAKRIESIRASAAPTNRPEEG